MSDACKLIVISVPVCVGSSNLIRTSIIWIGCHGSCAYASMCSLRLSEWLLNDTTRSGDGCCSRLEPSSYGSTTDWSGMSDLKSEIVTKLRRNVQHKHGLTSGYICMSSKGFKSIKLLSKSQHCENILHATHRGWAEQIETGDAKKRIYCTASTWATLSSVTGWTEHQCTLIRSVHPRSTDHS